MGGYMEGHMGATYYAALTLTLTLTLTPTLNRNRNPITLTLNDVLCCLLRRRGRLLGRLCLLGHLLRLLLLPLCLLLRHRCCLRGRLGLLLLLDLRRVKVLLRLLGCLSKADGRLDELLDLGEWGQG